MIFTKTHNGIRPYGTTEGEARSNCMPVSCKKTAGGQYKVSFDCKVCVAYSVEPRGEIKQGVVTERPKSVRRSNWADELGI